MEPEELRVLIAEGKAIIPCNKLHTSIDPTAISSMLKTKINVNLVLLEAGRISRWRWKKSGMQTTGVYRIADAEPEFVARQIDRIFADIRPDAVKIGMVSRKETIGVIEEKLK